MQDKDGHSITCCNCEFKKKSGKPRPNSVEPCKSCDIHYSSWEYKDWKEG